MSHANARTTPVGRLLIVDRHRAGWPQAHIAAAMGISRKCVKKWLDRTPLRVLPGWKSVPRGHTVHRVAPLPCSSSRSSGCGSESDVARTGSVTSSGCGPDGLSRPGPTWAAAAVPAGPDDRAGLGERYLVADPRD